MGMCGGCGKYHCQRSRKVIWLKKSLLKKEASSIKDPIGGESVTCYCLPLVFLLTASDGGVFFESFSNPIGQGNDATANEECYERKI